MLAGRKETEVVADESVSHDEGNAAAAGWLVFAAAIVVVLGLTTAMMLVLTDVSLAAAVGIGLYCAFWLGIGFGIIFGSAVVFGRQH